MANRFFSVTMLITICQDVIEKGINRNDDDNLYAIETLKKLLMSVKWRKHIVCVPDMDENDIDSLAPLLTKEETKLLKFVHSKRQYSFPLINRLSIYTKITFLEDTKKSDNVIVLNPRTHTDFELYEETHFIVENILDARFYAHAICKFFQERYKLHPACFTFEYYPVQGGGATISDVVKNELNLKQHFCFAVCDSDKKYEESQEEGDTAKGIRTVFSENITHGGNPFHADFYVMSKVREIENLIPFCVLDFYSNSLQKQFIAHHKSQLSFFDMKVGFEYRILYDNDVYEGWKKVFPDEIDWHQINLYKTEANDYVEFCNKVNSLPSLVSGWGKSILKNILNPDTKIRKDNKYRLYEISEGQLTTNQKEEWDTIGRHVFSWCCRFTNPPR